MQQKSVFVAKKEIEIMPKLAQRPDLKYLEINENLTLKDCLKSAIFDNDMDTFFYKLLKK